MKIITILSGTYIPLECNIENQSKKSMEIRATLKQVVTYYAQGKTRVSKAKIVVANGTPIQPLISQKEVLSLFVPSTTMTSSESCEIIKIGYIIVVTLVIPGSRDLHCELPVIIINESIPIELS